MDPYKGGREAYPLGVFQGRWKLLTKGRSLWLFEFNDSQGLIPEVFGMEPPPLLLKNIPKTTWHGNYTRTECHVARALVLIFHIGARVELATRAKEKPGVFMLFSGIFHQEECYLHVEGCNEGLCKA